jgi:hypothetical protein
VSLAWEPGAVSLPSGVPATAPPFAAAFGTAPAGSVRASAAGAMAARTTVASSASVARVRAAASTRRISVAAPR